MKRGGVGLGMLLVAAALVLAGGAWFFRADYYLGTLESGGPHRARQAHEVLLRQGSAARLKVFQRLRDLGAAPVGPFRSRLVALLIDLHRQPGAEFDTLALEYLAFAHWMEPDPLQQKHQLQMMESLASGPRAKLRCLLSPPAAGQPVFPRVRCGLTE